jgi:hypothetical protein
LHTSTPPLFFVVLFTRGGTSHFQVGVCAVDRLTRAHV